MENRPVGITSVTATSSNLGFPPTTRLPTSTPIYAGVISTSPPTTNTPTPKPTLWVIVANTGGIGVFTRRTPQMADKLRPWPDGTRLEVVGDDQDGDGHHWKHVRSPDGQIGWVPEEYVIAASDLPAANVAVSAERFISEEFKPLSLKGAYMRDDGTLYGRPEAALYGIGSGYNQGTFEFTVTHIPSNKTTLVLIGLDDELDQQCSFQVLINNTTLFQGYNHFPHVPTGDVGIGGKDRYWGQMEISVPVGVLRAGTNTLILRNTDTWRGQLGVPFILINSVAFQSEP